MTSLPTWKRTKRDGRGDAIRRPPARVALTVVSTLTLVAATLCTAGGSTAGAADPTFTVSATTGLVDAQTIDIDASGLASGVTYVIVECGPAAIAIVTGSRPDGDINPEDGCDAQSAYVRFTGDGSTVHAAASVHVVLNAAVGPIDCRVEQCFVALFPLAGSAPLHLQNISFGAGACAAAGSCAPGTRPGVAGRDDPAPARATPAPSVEATATPGLPASVPVEAAVAGDLTAVGSVTGEVTGAFVDAPPPTTPVTGEGVVRLDLAAPGTDWGANVPSSVVADVSVDGGTAQQIVLFNGATPFVYAGGLGTLTTGAHTVTIAVDTALSHPGSGSTRIDVHDVQVLVVDPSNASYDTIHYAPIVWGRSTSALHDTPLLEYGSTAVSGSGKTARYTMVFSHENSGTAFVPFMESGVWGRTTDIESFFTATTDAAGTPTGGSFLSGNTPDDYPDTQNAISEPTVDYTTGVWDGGSHGVVRVATGNNDFSQNGTTAFRFRPVPVPAPAAGQPREAVMDTNPWTYRIAGEEVARWYTNFSADPVSPEQGDARQYAYVQLDSSGAGVDQVAIDVQLAGGSTWYANDLGSGYDTGGTGTDRTVIKLPVDWRTRTITAIRIRVFPADASSSLQVQGLKILGLDGDWNLTEIAVPSPEIVPGFLFVPADEPTGPSTTATPSTSEAPTSAVPTSETPTSTTATSLAPEPTTTRIGDGDTGVTSATAAAATPVQRAPSYTG